MGISYHSLTLKSNSVTQEPGTLRSIRECMYGFSTSIHSTLICRTVIERFVCLGGNRALNSGPVVDIRALLDTKSILSACSSEGHSLPSLTNRATFLTFHTNIRADRPFRNVTFQLCRKVEFFEGNQWHEHRFQRTT
jgi:hypothetical protein